MARAKLTMSAVQKLRPDPDGRDLITWDTDLTGLGVRVKPSGQRSYVVQYRIGRRSRRMVLGRADRISLDQARKLAREAFGKLAQGIDPMQARDQQRAGGTVNDLADLYLERHARPHKKTAHEDERLIDKNLRPALGRLRVVEVTRADVARMHHALRDTPALANRLLSLVHHVFALAQDWGLRPEGPNPASRIKRYAEKRVERYLSEAELADLGEVLAQIEREGSEPASAIGGIRLALLTGMRRNELQLLRWSDVSFEERRIRLPDSKTGPKRVALNAQAIQVLDQLKTDSEWVLPAAHGGPYKSLSRAWRRIRKRAGLEDVRFHDLRHTHATMGVGGGLSLFLVGKLLGHRRSATTERYAHASDDPLQQASEAVGSRIAAALAGEEAEVRRLRS